MDRGAYLVHGNLPLVRGSLLRIEEGRDMEIAVWSGGVWITQEGDARDRFVPAGGSFTISARGLTLVSPLGRSSVTLTTPYQSNFAECIELVHADGRVQPLLQTPPSLLRSWVSWFVSSSRPTTAAY